MYLSEQRGKETLKFLLGRRGLDTMREHQEEVDHNPVS